jgi:hypothetical protein
MPLLAPLVKTDRLDIKPRKAVNHEGHEGTPRKSIDWDKYHNNLFGDSLLPVN